jgi:hypothetical protein
MKKMETDVRVQYIHIIDIYTEQFTMITCPRLVAALIQ